MKTHILSAACAAVIVLALASCRGGNSSKFEVTNYTANDSNSYAVTAYEVDYPTAGPALLVDSIRAWISTSLGGTYTGDLNDGQALISFYQKETDDSFRADRELIIQEAKENGEDIEDSWYMQALNEEYQALNFAWSNEQFVTYDHSSYVYYAGAAHGIGGSFGTTFLVADGTKVTWDDITDTTDEDFQAICREGMRSYFDAENDEELAENLFLNDDATVFRLPMPAQEPCIRAEGVEFMYAPYEISYYAAGTPCFTVPMKKIYPFLSPRLQQLIDPETFSEDADSDEYKHRADNF